MAKLVIFNLPVAVIFLCYRLALRASAASCWLATFWYYGCLCWHPVRSHLHVHVPTPTQFWTAPLLLKNYLKINIAGGIAEKTFFQPILIFWVFYSIVEFDKTIYH